MAVVRPTREGSGLQSSTQQTKLLKDPASKKYQERDGSIFFPSFAQSDFMFVPTLYTGKFAEAAELHLKHGIFLECAFPKIVDILRRSGLKTRDVKLCTDWNTTHTRGTKESIVQNCIYSKESFGFMHPLYRSRSTYKDLAELYDRIQ